jgi:hypothetical protein
MAWVETSSLSFTARHDSRHADSAAQTLDELEGFRVRLEGSFDRTPGEVAVVIHPRPLQLTLAQPWLPLARLAAAPASRRYFAGWFTSSEIHVLAPPALERRASKVPGSREALMRSPQHEYAHLVIGANNPELPPPFSVATFRRYVRRAWLCEGAATWLSGQTALLRGAVARRLREGPRPAFPPSARDAQLLGGTIFEMLAREAGADAAVDLTGAREADGDRSALAEAFGRPSARIERDWRDHLDAFVAAE